jgi:hypothetical protein
MTNEGELRKNIFLLGEDLKLRKEKLILKNKKIKLFKIF